MSLRPFFIHLWEALDFDKGQDCWLPRDSVFIHICNKRYISKPKNKEMGSVSGKTDSLMSFFSAPRFSGWIPIWSMDAIPRNPSYSASFSPLIFLLHYPFLISLYLWLNMYFSKDADSIPPPSNHPGSTGAGPRQRWVGGQAVMETAWAPRPGCSWYQEMRWVAIQHRDYNHSQGLCFFVSLSMRTSVCGVNCYTFSC